MCKTMFEADAVMQKLVDTINGRIKGGSGFIHFTTAELDMVKELAEWAEGTRFYVRFQNDKAKSEIFNEQLKRMTAEDLLMLAMMKYEKTKREGTGMAGVALIMPELWRKLEGEKNGRKKGNA